MRYFLFFITNMIVGQGLIGQYASHKSMPDKSQSVISDFNDWSYKISTTISVKDLKDHIYTLASDEYEGRETGTDGNTKAANYIAGEFEKLGLPTIGHNESYFQPVAFTFTSWDKLTLDIGDLKYKLLRDFISFPQYSINGDFDAEEIIFLGYGIDDVRYNDYNNVDVRDKVLMVFDGEPTDANGISLITKSTEKSKWSTDWQSKSEVAKKHGAKMLLIVSNDLKTMINDNRRQLVNRVTQLGDYSIKEQQGINTIFLSSKIAEEILGDKRDDVIMRRNKLTAGENVSLHTVIPSSIQSTYGINRNVLEGQNVMGYIEGSSKKDEVVVVSAHYDHVGMKGDEVYNGADDNASGTTAVLEIAEALATAKKMKNGPKRSVLCLLVTGEEKGLLGSEYYASNPIFPIENTIVDVNIDMIGRWGKEYTSQEEPYIYVIGSDRLSQDLHDINEKNNRKYSQLLLDYKYNDEEDPNRFYFRSDHYNFAKHGIPAIFFFNGVHDDYHRLTDTVEKIDLNLMEHRTKQIFHTVWDLANRDDRIRVNDQVK